MTREEAIEFLYSIAAELGFTDIEERTCRDGEKMREAIKILEQEPVLDKIRSDILDLHVCAFSTKEILRIIDNYRIESEEK